MATIDERVVRMKFDNKQFQQGINTTISVLDKFKQKLNFSKSTESVEDLQDSVNSFKMEPMARGTEAVVASFNKLNGVAINVLSNIANKAIGVGTNLAKSLTIDPIMEGFQEYELQMDSVQTILANTKSKGSTLDDVNGALKELNTYADETIYNFGEMTRNIGTFTAAGVDLETSTSSIKGIANLAAISGSKSDQASNAMYQLSQAISTGSLKLQDWNSVVNAGMGGQVFQEALFETGKAMGTLTDVPMGQTFEEWTDSGNSFRESLEDGWITTDVLTNTLEGFTGDLTDAQLEAMGYTEEQIKGIQEMGAMGKSAATDVKTLTQLIDTLQEGVGSGWAETWEIVFGDFEQAKELFTNVSEAIGPIIDESSDARNKMLSDWAELGGREDLIDGIGNLFNTLMDVVEPIQKAFENIFPPATGKQLADLTESFLNFTEKLKLSDETSKNLQRTFEGVFAIFSIVGQIISGVVGVLFNLVGAASSGAGGFLEITASIGDFIVWIDRALKEGELLSGFFEFLGTAISAPIQVFGSLFGAISDFVGAAGDAVGGAEGITDAFSNMGETIGNIFSTLGGWIMSAVEYVQNGIKTLIDGITGAFEGFDFTNVLKGLTAGGLGVLALNIRNFIKEAGGLKDIFKDGLDLSFGLDMGQGGLVDSVKDVFGSLTETMSLMQTELKSDILIKIAVAIGILTASVVAISLIDSDKLAVSLTAIGIMMAELGGTLALLEKIQMTDPTKIPILAGSMILLATALLLMSAAARSFATMDWEDLAKGLVGTSVALGVLVTAAKFMPDGKRMLGSSVGLIAMAGALLLMSTAVKSFAEMDWHTMGRGLAGAAAAMATLTIATKFIDKKGLITTGVGLIAMAGALLLMSEAMKSMADMDWHTMGRGLAGVAGALTVLTVATKFLDPKGMIATGLGIAAIGGGLLVITEAMKSMAEMEWEEMGRGGAGLAGALVAIAGAMHIMPKNLMGLGAGLLMVSAAIYVISSALKEMSSIEPGQMATAVIGLGGALAVLAVGLKFMTGTLAGSGALLVASLALGALAPVLIMLGNTPWQVIAAGLGALAGVFVVLGVAGYALAPVVVPILAVAGAMTLFSVAALIAGTALATFASALGMLAGPASAGLEVLSGMLALIPEALGKLAEGFLEMLAVLAENLGMLTETILVVVGGVVVALLELIVDLIPKFVEVFIAIGTAIMDVILELMPQFIEVVSQLIDGVLGLLEEYLPRIIDLIVDLLVQIVNGIAEAAPQVGSAFLTLIMAIVDVIATGVPMIAERALQMIIAFINVITANIGQIVAAAVQLILAFVNGIAQQIPVVVDAGARMIIDLVNGIAEAIRANSGALGDAAANLGLAIIEGLVSAIAGAASRVWTAITGVVGNAIEGAKNLLGINSPSKVFMAIGDGIIEGFVIGVDDGSGDAANATGEMAKGVIKSAEDELDINSPSGVFMDIGENVNEGMAKGIEESEDKPVAALEGTLDSMIGTTDKKTRELENSTGSFYDTLLGQFNNNPATKRLEQLAAHSRAAHATAVKENKLAEEEREYQAKEEKRKVYEDVEEAKKNLREARDDSAEAAREAREAESDSQKSANEEVKHERDIQGEKKKITDAEKRLQDAERQRDIYEYRMHGEEAGVSFVDGVAVGMMESKDEIPTVAEILSGLLLAEVDEMEGKINDAFNIFDEAVNVRDTVKTITDHVRELERALNRMANTTNDNSFRRNRDMVIDSILAIGSELIGLISVIQVFEPYLPQLLTMFESSLGGIIPLVAQFAPGLAATLGGGLAAALPAIAGPAGAIIAAVSGIWLVLKDSAENQYILNFLEHIVNGIGPFLASIPGKLSDFITMLVTGLVNVLDRLPEIIVALIHGIVDGLVAFITGLPEVLPVLVEGIITALIAVIEALPEIVIAVATALVEAFIKAIPLLIEFVIFRLPPLLLELAFALITGLVNALGAAVDGSLALLLAPFQLIVKLIGGVFAGVDYLVTGRDLIGDLLGGFLEGISNLKDAIIRPFKSIFEFIESLLPWNIFHTLGLDVMDGLFWGMVDGLVALAEKIFSPFRWLIDEIKDIFGIRSPSRVMMEVGGYVMEGFSKGVLDGAEDSRLDIRKAIENTLKDLEDGPDGTITITPIIDLTEAEKSLAGMDGRVDISTSGNYEATRAIAEMQSQSSRSGDEVSGDVTNIYYTQNNTSPEPLRAIDIYRNTQKQLDLMK